MACEMDSPRAHGRTRRRTTLRAARNRLGSTRTPARAGHRAPSAGLDGTRVSGPVSATRRPQGTSAICSVGISLMVSPETEAAIEYVRATMPNAIIDCRDVFYKIERDGSLTFD